MPATASTAAVWAIASISSTPGMIGSAGKWPWKNHSLIVTVLMPDRALEGARISTTRSISRNG